MAHTSGNAPRATRHKKKTQRNDARANARTGKQQDNVAGKTGKQRRADRRKTDILRDTVAQSLRRLTNEAIAEVNRVHKNDPGFAKWIVKEGEIIGVFDISAAKWLLAVVRSVSRANGSVQHREPKPAASTTNDAAGTNEASGNGASGMNEDSDGATLSPEELEKQKRAAYMRVYRAQENGKTINMARTVAGETLVRVVRITKREGESALARPECYQQRFLATPNAVRKWATKYEDLTPFDANPSRTTRDLANYYASPDSQDPDFDAEAVDAELQPGDLKAGSEAEAEAKAKAEADATQRKKLTLRLKLPPRATS